MEKSLAIQVKMMKLVGLWPINYDQFLSKKVQKFKISTVLNVIYYGMWYCVALHMAIFHVIAVYQKTQSGSTAEDIIMLLLQTYIYISMILLIMYFNYFIVDIKEAVAFLVKNFKHRSAPGISFVSMDKCFNYTRKFTIFWIAGCSIGTLHWTLSPIISRDFSRLPFQIWYPFDLNVSPNYELAYIGQILGQLQVGVVYGCTSSLFVAFVSLTCGQFDIFFCSLRNIQNTALLKCGGHLKDLQQLQEDHFRIQDWPIIFYIAEEKQENLKDYDKLKPLKTELEPFLNEALVECIEHHLTILSFSKKIEKIFCLYNLLSTTTSIFLMCVLAYLASTFDITNFNLISVGQYFLLSNAHSFLLCYWGQMLQSQVDF